MRVARCYQSVATEGARAAGSGRVDPAAGGLGCWGLVLRKVDLGVEFDIGELGVEVLGEDLMVQGVAISRSLINQGAS